MNQETLNPHKYLVQLIERRPDLSPVQKDLENAFSIILESQLSGGKLLIAGNGGSAADALHIEGELIKGFNQPRPIDPLQVKKLEAVHPVMGAHLGKLLQKPIRAQALTAATALMTAIINDTSSDVVFAQQVFGYGKANDIFLAITTSGNSRNVLYAAITARSMGIKTVALTGNSGGLIKELVDVVICAPGENTPQIQESHLPIYHTLCLMLEEALFSSNPI